MEKGKREKKKEAERGRKGSKWSDEDGEMVKKG